MSSMKKRNRLVDEYVYPGFRPLLTIENHPTDKDARIISLQRRQKKISQAVVEKHITFFMTEKLNLQETCPVLMQEYIYHMRSDALSARDAEK